MKRTFLTLGGAALLSGLALSTTARADIPAGYTGTPFKGTPIAIPGRVNLIDYDKGGSPVAFQVVHQGDVGCAGGDYRTDKPAPTLCKTSAGEGDKWIAPSQLAGTTYPSATTADYYIGAIRPGDWVNVTVDVKQAGSYKMITTWASDGPSIDIKLSFNNVQKIEIKVPNTGTGGTGYHNWRPDDNVGTIQLDVGVQVMKFQSVNEHVNMDYLEFQLVGADGGIIPTPDSGAGGAPGAGGAAGAAQGGAAGAVAAGGAAGAVAAGGAAGAVAAGGAAGDAQGGAAGAVAAGGAAGAVAAGGAAGATTGAGGAAGTTAAGAAGTTAPAETAADSGGCSCSLENRSASRNAALATGLLFAAIALRRIRRRS
jgi:MYXO-CTERM domain-containing protein